MSTKRNSLPAILVAALVAVLLQACSNRLQSYREYIDLSLALYTSEEYQKSIEAAQEALKLEPNSAVAYNNICAAYNQLKEWNKAIEACGKALAIDPGFELAKNNLGAAIIASSTSAAGPTPGGSPTPGVGPASTKSYEDYINDSVTFYNAGDYQKSLEAAQSALQLQPNSATAYNNICSAYNQLKEWDKAIQACGKAVAIDPNFELAKNNLGAAIIGSQAGAKSYEEYINDSLTLYNAGEYQKSVEAAQSALQLQPNSAVAYNNICAAYNKMEEWDKAIEACEKALAIEPDYERAKNNLRIAQRGKQ